MARPKTIPEAVTDPATDHRTPWEKFREFAGRIVAVPKDEVDREPPKRERRERARKR